MKEKSKTEEPAARGPNWLPRFVRRFPVPWEVDVSPQETPPTRRSATIYAADSTRICQTNGEHAEELANLIMGAVNNFLQNVEHTHGPATHKQPKP